MTRCEKLDQICFSLREMQVKALLFVIRGAVNMKMVWRAARTLPFHLPSPHLVDWSDFPVPSTTTSIYSQLTERHRICLLTPSTNNSLNLAVQSWHSSRAEGLVPTNSALCSCLEAVSERWKCRNPLPSPWVSPGHFFFSVVFFTAISWVVAEMQTESAPDRLKTIRNVSELLEQRFCYDNKECSLLVYYFKRRKLKRNISWRSWQCSKPTSCCYPWAWYYILLAAVRWTFPLGPFQALNPDPRGPPFSLLKGEREINLPADSAVGLLCPKNISTVKKKGKKVQIEGFFMMWISDIYGLRFLSPGPIRCNQITFIKHQRLRI